MLNTQKQVREAGARRKLNDYAASNEFGLWEVIGESDDGSPFGPPHLGYFQGRYGDVVEWAIQQPSFYSWGNGGSIKRWKSPKITKLDAESIRQRANLAAEIADIEKKLEAKKQELRDA